MRPRMQHGVLRLACGPSWSRIGLVAAGLFASLIGPAIAQSPPPPRTRQAKAEVVLGSPGDFIHKLRFIRTLSQFTEWPADSFPHPRAPILVGILQPETPSPRGKRMPPTMMLAERHQLQGSRPVMTMTISSYDDARLCHVLFVPAAATTRSQKILSALKESPILTIGETESFAKDGGIATVTMSKGRCEYEINEAAARRAKISISSRVLALAAHVYRDTEPR